MNKKLLLGAFFIICSLISSGLSAQATKQINFGGLGTGIYGGLELPVSSAISIQPYAETDWDFNRFIIAAKGNYYFDDLFELNQDWDVYAGLNLGWRIDNSNDKEDGVNLGIHIGGRWFWNEKWGLNAEFGGGTAVLGGLGVTMKL